MGSTATTVCKGGRQGLAEKAEQVKSVPAAVELGSKNEVTLRMNSSILLLNTKVALLPGEGNEQSGSPERERACQKKKGLRTMDVSGESSILYAVTIADSSFACNLPWTSAPNADVLKPVLCFASFVR